MTDQTDGRRGVGKSDAAFRTISEVASELDVPQHVLRFWETKFSQIRPMKRGGGRRYYRPEDVVLLGRIRALLYDDGLTIKGVQKLLREKGVKTLVADPQPLPATLAAAEEAAGLAAPADEMPAAVREAAPEEAPGGETRLLASHAAPVAEATAAARLPAAVRREIEAALQELESLRDELAAELRRQEAA